VHRDIKPDNMVFSNEEGLEGLKIIDFGLAMSLENNQFGLCGTPGYIAPEVFLNQEDPLTIYDFKADIFSAGAILYKLYQTNY